jgi:hypothetical protein
VGAKGVVGATPALDEDLGLLERRDDLAVEQLVPEPALGLDPYALTYHTMSTGLSLSRRLGQSADSGRARPGRLQGGEGHQGQA